MVGKLLCKIGIHNWVVRRSVVDWNDGVQEVRYCKNMCKQAVQRRKFRKGVWTSWR